MTLDGLIIHTLDRHKNNLAFRTAEHQVSADDREAGEGRRRAGECMERERERGGDHQRVLRGTAWATGREGREGECRNGLPTRRQA